MASASRFTLALVLIGGAALLAGCAADGSSHRGYDNRPARTAEHAETDPSRSTDDAFNPWGDDRTADEPEPAQNEGGWW